MKHLICLLAIVLFKVPLFAQKNVPSWVKMQNVSDLPDIKINQSNNGSYYMVFEEQLNTVLKQNFYHYAQKITSESGLKSCSQIETSYDPAYERVEFNILRVIRNGKIIDKLDPSKFRTLNEENERYDGIITNKKTIYRNLDDVQTGDIVEFAYTFYGYKKIFGNINSYQFYLGNSEPVGKIFIKTFFDKQSKPQIYTYNTDIKCNVDSSNGNYVYEWNISNPQPLIVEENYPYWFNPFPHVVLTNYKSWQDFKNVNRGIVLANRSQNQMAVKLAGELTKDVSDKEEKLTKLVNYVQNNIRYNGNENGIYSHTAHSPNEVIKNMYGDCKDKSVLLCELLKTIGYEAYPALISTNYRSEVLNLPASHLWFDHCIVALKHDDGNFQYIDPTIAMQGGTGTTKKVPNYETAVILDSTANIFSDVPTDKSSYSRIKEIFTIDNATKDATLAVTNIHHGSYADNTRYYFHDNSLAKAQVAYKEYYNKYSTKIMVLDSISFKDDEITNTFIVYEKYRLPQFWVSADTLKSRNIEKDFIPYALNDNMAYANTETRKYPFQLGFPVNSEQEIKIVIKGGWNVKDKNFALKNDHFLYSYNSIAKGDTLILSYQLVNYKKYVTPEEYPEYKSQTDQVDRNMVFNALVQQETEPGNFNYIYLITCFCTLLVAVFAIVHLNRVNIQTGYTQYYTSIGGWLVLVAINLILAPIISVSGLITDFNDAMKIDYNQLYFHKAASTREYFNGIFELAVVAFNLLVFIFSVFLIYVFFQRKTTFRIYFISLKTFNIVFIIINIAYLNYYNNELQSQEISGLVSKLTITLFRIIVNFAIWGSYVWFSERSRYTFTVGNTIIAPEPDTFNNDKTG